MDGIDSIAGLYILYLLFLRFTDRANFWLWVVYGFIALFLLYGILFAISKFKNKREAYFPYQRYFRPQPTPEARKLGDLLRGYGWNVEFEKWDGHKHIDIAITEAKFNIEVEGSQHNLNPNQAFTDQLRDFYSDQRGFVTKRIPNSLLKDDVRAEETAKLLNKQLQERVTQLRK